MPNQGIEIDNLTVDENLDGAVIGTVTLSSQLGNDPRIVVSDNRFELVDGVLRLKPGESLDFETEPTVTVTVTADDPSGLSLSGDFEIAVQDVQEAAVITGDSVGGVTVGDEVDTVSGNLDHTDEDLSDQDDVWSDDVSGSGSGTYGDLTMGTDGQWVYTLDNSRAATQALEDGQQAVDSFTVATTGGTTTHVSITVTGTDSTQSEAPVPDLGTKEPRQKENSNGDGSDPDAESDPGSESDPAAESDPTAEPEPSAEPSPPVFGEASIVEGTQSDLRLLSDEDLALGYSFRIGGREGYVTDGIYTFDASAIDAPEGGYESQEFTYEVLDSAGVVVEERSYTVSIRDTVLAEGGEVLSIASELSISLHGGNGDDYVVGANGGDNLLSGGLGSDFVFGKAGNDLLYGGDGGDYLDGGAGNDRMFGEGGSDDLWGQDGDDQLFGGGGSDALHGGLGNDSLYGGRGSDTLNGGHGDDILRGASGNDTLHGNDGVDDLAGGDGMDHLNGGSGDDVLDGGNSHDHLYGGDGHDVLEGGEGNDTLHGDEGNDDLAGGDGMDHLYGGSGDDVLDGGNSHDHLYGGDGHDAIYGENGDDTLHGGSDDDVLGGGEGDDTLHGDEGNDNLAGGDGIDHLHGGSGDDVLKGGNSHDYLSGGDGHDVIEGGRGVDSLHGNSGSDTFRFGDDWGDDLIGDFEAGVDIIEFFGNAGPTSYQELLTNIVEDFGSTTITWDSGGTTSSIFLTSVLISDLSESDFLFS